MLLSNLFITSAPGVCNSTIVYSLLPVWPDWAVFEISLLQKFLKSGPNIPWMLVLFWKRSLFKSKLLWLLFGQR